MLLNVPNMLTILRIVLIPAVAWFLWQGDDVSRLIAFGLYFLAGVTDFLDGYLARSLGQTSAIGRFLDPIADKLLVACIIMVLTANQQLTGIHFLAGLIIMMREITVSGLREFLGGIQVSVPVSSLAKWKTTAQILSLGFLIIGSASDPFPWEFLSFFTFPSIEVGLIMLWLAAVLTVITGVDYLRAGLKHMK